MSGAVLVEKQLRVIIFLPRHHGVELHVGGKRGAHVELRHEHACIIRLAEPGAQLDVEGVEAEGVVAEGQIEHAVGGRRDPSSYAYRPWILEGCLEGEHRFAVGAEHGLRVEVGEFAVGHKAVVGVACLLHSERAPGVAGAEDIVDEARLVGTGSGDGHRVEHDHRRSAAESPAAAGHGLGRYPRGSAPHNGVDHSKTRLVSDVVYDVGGLEIEDTEVEHRHLDLHAHVGGKRVVVVLDYHVFKLTVGVPLLRLGVGARHRDADDEVWIEVIVHHVDRKIVVDAAVIHEHTVHLYGTEHHGEAHRGPHGIAEGA